MSFDMEEKEFLEEESSVDVKSIIPKIIRIWPLILISTFLFLFASYIYTRMTVPQFKVSGLFFIKDNDSKFSLFESSSIAGDSKNGLVNEMTILKSRPIAEITLQQLDFDVEYFFRGAFTDIEQYQNTPVVVEVNWKVPQIVDGLITLSWVNDKSFKVSFDDKKYSKYLPDGSKVKLEIIPQPTIYNFGEWIETNNFTLKVSKTNSESQGEILLKFRDVNSLKRDYASSLNVETLEKGGSILQMNLNTANVRKGEVYINTLMETYLKLELEEKNEIASNTVRFIDSQVAGVSDSLKQFENQLQSFRSDNKIYNLDAESSSVFDQLTEVESELRKEEFKRTYYKNLGGYLNREQYNDLVAPSGIGIDDPILNSLISNLMELQVEKSKQLATLTEQAPLVQATNNKIRNLNRSIQEILKNVDSNSILLIEDLKNRIEEYEGSFRNLPKTEQNLIRIERQFALNENIYNFLMEKRAEAAITKASNSSENKIIEPASGGYLISPIPLKNYIVGLFIGFILPIILVFIRELARTKIEDLKFLESKLKIPILASILFNKSDTNLVVLNKGKSGIAEGFRSLRANLKFVLQKDEQITMMVTSTISGEGKTFCAINLASVYSLTGKKTILVGCDMRKPKIFEDFNLSNDKGLSNYLSGQEKDLKTVIRKTNFNNLDLLLAGPIPPNPAELLYSENFRRLIDELKKEYDVVILDTPPVGLVSETLDLLSYVDLTIFVFRQDYSQRGFVQNLNDLKLSKGVKNIYAVFNCVDGSKKNYGYGYTYGYGHNYGYYEDEKK